MTTLIGQALVFIVSAVILVPIFRWLRLGSVLGYLMAGLIVGPYGFHLIVNSDSVINFADLGIVLLLFLIGLEIQPRKLWSMRRHLFGLGLFQILLSSVLFFFIAMACGLEIISASVIGFALSLSSTAFALQTLTERNQFSSEFGRASFSILLMQDLVAIPALALIPLLSHDDKPNSINLLGSVSVIALILFIFFASRYLIRPLFRIIASSRAQEIFTAATLLIVLGVAELMQSVGLSAALGTFVAGVLLADSEYRHELEANLEPFKNLLMGLFFIGVGMSVQLDLFLTNPILLLVLTLVYLGLKFLSIYAAGRLFKMNHQNSTRMGLTIIQGGEFAFVIFSIILHLNQVASQTLALLTALITLSMALSPLLGLAYDVYRRRQDLLVQPNYDDIKDEFPEVIIAGFGRFGQIFGRILRAQNIPFVAIDHNSEQIELVRRHGNKVYFGDASRKELLIAAGVSHAKYFILCIDDVEASRKIAELLIESFPQIKIFARARNRGHAFDLMALGISRIKRETLDSSVYFVRDLLVEMGFQPTQAAEVVEKFKRHDELMLIEQFKVRDDDKNFINLSKQSTAQLAQVLSNESNQSYIDLPK